ncbi:FkbM family methyltransferase [Polynucleobacter sp. MWH-UH19D]|uniref:FkbM family methyltransferase n=1 Tax=Polynucleobacter sp. MWH-UH19D TaxID=1855610 RepID=UPI003364B96B
MEGSKLDQMLPPNINKSFKSFLSKIIRNIPHGRISFSQEGEDLILSRIFQVMGIKNGFYVDIGAHHPFRFSNTYYFYKRGWRGINIDALPGTKKIFNFFRPRDITIECGISSIESTMTYYAFNESALNTFSKEEAQSKESSKYKIIDEIQISVTTLKKVLDNYLPMGAKIDFMSIDVEGLDHEVICSNDWLKYRPTIIAVELLNSSIEDIRRHPTAAILFQHNYKILAKTHNTFFFSQANA